MASHAAELKLPQAGGVQREPSMEEILASIRRIIEDSDQVRKPDDVLPGREPGEERAHAAAEERAGMVAPNALAAAFELPKPLRPEDEQPAAAMRQPEPAPSDPHPAPERARSEMQPAARRPEPAEPVVAASIFDGPAAPEPVMSAPAGDAAASAPAEPVAQAAPAAVEKASLISERTGRQVAAAFGELSEAFEASRRKSFDELASEMMRPMLQDWLDNNLPTLVEKLVREEIERVARGGR